MRVKVRGGGRDGGRVRGRDGGRARGREGVRVRDGGRGRPFWPRRATLRPFCSSPRGDN